MILYVASHSQAGAKGIAQRLRAAGHEVNSRWLTESFKPTDQYTPQERRTIALMDANDVYSAHALVLEAHSGHVPGGKFVEAGIALGLGKSVYVLGRRENMLLWHPCVHQFDTLEDLLTHISRAPTTPYWDAST